MMCRQFKASIVFTVDDVTRFNNTTCKTWGKPREAEGESLVIGSYASVAWFN